MSDLQARMDQVRQNILDTVDGLTAKATEYKLPAPPDALAICRQRLSENTYQVLVVGEVKRGKSSFINALIGQHILPTDVDVATSQVFRVCRAEREAYRLRFEDGSAKEIKQADLPRYGSQVVADVEGAPRLDQIIRWIEIDVPVRFLPRGVSILDTPGLGGLYELHAEITQRFIPQADAVVFVLDSSRPIIEEELKYLDMILKATRSVFFIQTKFDLFRGQQWQDVQRRNQEILRERFKDRLTDYRVWPISSKLLSTAATQGDPDFEIASKHRELAPALQAFLFRVSGWTRAAETLIVANDFHGQSSQVLTGRQRALLEESKQQREDIQRQLGQRKEQFLNDWGERGQKRRELKEGIKKVATLGKAHISQYLARGGDLEASLQSKVAAADSLDALRSVADRLASDAAARAMRAWREVSEHSWKQCLALLAPLLKAAEDVTAPYQGEDEDSLSPAGSAPQITRDWYAKMKGARFDFMTGIWAGGVGGGIGGGLLVALGVISAPVIAPLAAVAALIGGLWAMIRGTRTIDQNQLRTAKQEVSRYASDVCQRVRQHFLDVNLAAGSFSPVDEYFNQLEKIAEEQVEKLTRKKAVETETEIARLKKEAELTEQQRKAEAEQIRGQMVAWNALGRTLHDAGEKLQLLDQAAGPPQAVASGPAKSGGPSAGTESSGTSKL
jgi:GTPase SAR1 family protein